MYFNLAKGQLFQAFHICHGWKSAMTGRRKNGWMFLNMKQGCRSGILPEINPLYAFHLLCSHSQCSGAALIQLSNKSWASVIRVLSSLDKSMGLWMVTRGFCGGLWGSGPPRGER